MKTEIIKKLIEAGVIAAAALCLLFLAGDDTLDPMPTDQWVRIKLIGVALLAALVLIVRYLYKKGWLPKYN